ncbi:hypothetical protein [Bradyrhizobium sp.]|uniref:hypothetical protein n=1 Tax=Bradyrhizobium sp. TaxID=376 RepID=UPI00262B4E9F|nr:hypothetical protein [Bradyrhizobium sp.]
MPKPLYVLAFEHFKNNHGDTLTGYVAFGMYIDSECKWAESQPAWPTHGKYKEWYDCYVPHGIAAHTEKATDVLQDFANNIVEQERVAFLEAALQEYKAEAAKSKKGFWDGVREAFMGAACWTIFLIAMAFVIKLVKPDFYEILGRVLGG